MRRSGPVYRDYSGPLQRAIFTRLDAAGIVDLNSDPVPIQDAHPQGCKLPYLQIGEDDKAEDFSTKTKAGQTITVKLTAWSKHGGFKEAQSISGQALTALTDPALDLSGEGFKVVQHLIDSGRNVRDPDGLTVRRIIELRFSIEDFQTVQS